MIASPILNYFFLFFFLLFLIHFTTRREAGVLLESGSLLPMEGRLIVSPWIGYKTGCVSLGVTCVSWVPALLCPWLL